jgi:hypothetical protein
MPNYDKACVMCPFKRKFPVPGPNLFSLIKNYLKMNKGNFACHEQGKEFGCSAKQMRKDHPELNTCYGYQQMLAGRQQRIFIRKLKDLNGKHELDKSLEEFLK